MIPIDVQASRSKVKVKGNVCLPDLMKWITQECFDPEALNLVGPGR